MSLFPSQPLEQIREGMTVVDESGTRLGKIVRVRMPDPEDQPAGETVAVAAPPDMDDPTRLTGTVPVFGDVDVPQDVPEEIQRLLLQTGFVEVDGPGLNAEERYIPGDRLGEVTGDQVVVRRPSPPSV